jgi:hypothetical protein
VAIDLMGTLHAAVGDLNRVTGIVKLMVLVNSTAVFKYGRPRTPSCRYAGRVEKPPPAASVLEA